MITIWKKIDHRLCRTAILEKDCWLEVSAPTEFEKETLEREHRIPRDFIQDVLDPDERPRMEKKNGTLFLIYRVPHYADGAAVRYTTIPVGLVLTESAVITLCAGECAALSELSRLRTPGPDPAVRKAFLLLFMNCAVRQFLGNLKTINQQTSRIEEQLQEAVKNTELIRLLRMEKSLVYFTTSLRANELLLAKLQRGFLLNRSPEEEESLDDLITESTQALEMSQIYSNILSGMMDAFASVISNNLNVVMKRLTQISIILMIPTFFASLYGMNIPLPFQDSPRTFSWILGVSALTAGTGAVFFSRTGRTAAGKGSFKKSRRTASL